MSKPVQQDIYIPIQDLNPGRVVQQEAAKDLSIPVPKQQQIDINQLTASITSQRDSDRLVSQSNYLPIAPSGSLVVQSPLRYDLNRQTVMTPSLQTNDLEPREIDRSNAELMKVPDWLQAGSIEGYLKASEADPLFFSMQLTAVPSISNVVIQGTGLGQSGIVAGKLLVKGQINGDLITLQLQNELGKSDLMTGSVSNGQQQKLSSALGDYTIWITNAYNKINTPKQMTVAYIVDCSKFTYDISNVIQYNTQLTGWGSDSSGDFVVAGSISTDGQSQFIKQYRSAEQQIVQYVGTLEGGVVQGKWRTDTAGVVIINQFAMYPKDYKAVSSIDLYGYSCKYPTSWTGYIILPRGDSHDAKLTDFKVAFDGTITANGSDEWGPSTYTGKVKDGVATIVKHYPDQDVQLQGTITATELSGDWNIDDFRGTFIYKPSQ